MANLGSDIHCVTDLDPLAREVSGRTALAHAIARRLQTTLGHLPYAPNMGTNLRAKLGTSYVQGSGLALLQSQIESECLKSERVDGATATVTASADDVVTIAVELVDADGPFTFVLEFSQVTGAIVLGQEPE
ncbi:MAG: hypothetical protein ACWGPR_08510 [Candidatus Deferrimicrobiaceae bacterium]